MKKIIIGLCCCLAISTYTRAQCSQEVELTSSKAEAVDSMGTVLRHEDGPVKIVITKTDVIITPKGDESQAIKGNIKAVSCKWKTPFKEGKEQIKADLSDAHGDVKHATIIIEAKDTGMTVLLKAQELPNDNLLVHIDKYELK